MVTAAEQAKPLTPAERRAMQALAERAGLTLAGPSVAAPDANVVIGDEYVALTNITVRRRDNTGQVDLVRAGEKVRLTDEQAAPHLRCDPGTDGRRIPVIRKVNDTREAERLARPLPRQLSGVMHAPPAGDGGTGPRPDPPGSSRIQVLRDLRVPEAAEPQPGSEAVPADDALDIPVSR